MAAAIFMPMNNFISRRSFMQKTALASMGAAALSSGTRLLAQSSAANKVRIAVIGVNSRGLAHLRMFGDLPGVEIAYICDVDSRILGKAVDAVSKKGHKPKGVADFRQVLEDKSVDAVSIATPNHWHAPAAILACQAGKHVYVEKPGSHDPHEAELIVAAAQKYNRIVQMGTQRRSTPWIMEAIDKIHSGVLGKVHFGRCWYNNTRGTIGTGQPTPVPEGFDFNMWQGPAPDRPFVNKLVPYNWHWRWHWGNGEVGNNGIHCLDVIRWGLQVDSPKRISCTGGRYHFKDDWETPDTCIAAYDFGDKGATFESHSCDPHGFENDGFGMMFYGEKGTLFIGGDRYKIYDPENKLVHEEPGPKMDKLHFQNFIDCVRSGKKPNAPIEEGQKSTMLCHLANIAYRTGHTLNFDPITKKVVGDSDAEALWKREYRAGWEPKV